MSESSRHIGRRRFLTLGSAAALLAACGAPEAGGPSAPAANKQPPASAAAGIAPTLRLGFQRPYIAVFALEQQRLLQAAFGAQAPAIEFRRLLSLDPIVEALVGGSVDLGMGGTPLGAIAAGQPIKVVALVERSPKTHAVLVAADSPIKSVADLRGKTIGTPSSQPSAFVVRALEDAGLAVSDVELIKIENNAGASALATGALDAWATWDPFYAAAEIEQGATPLVDGEKYITNYVTLFGHSDYVAAYPETVQRFLQGYSQALNWVKSNDEQAIKLFVEQNKLKPEVAERTYQRRNYLLSAPNDDYLADVQDQSKLLLRLGVIKAEPDWSSSVDLKLASGIVDD